MICFSSFFGLLCTLLYLQMMREGGKKGGRRSEERKEEGGKKSEHTDLIDDAFSTAPSLFANEYVLEITNAVTSIFLEGKNSNLTAASWNR